MTNSFEGITMRKAFMTALMLTTSLATPAILGGENKAHAQQDVYQGVISSIVVEGNQRVESRTVQSYLLVQPGDPLDPDRIDLSLKTLFATGLFADVAFDVRGNTLVVRVVENPVINRVLFEGNSAIDDDKMREEIQAKPRGIFTAARVQSDVQRIIELYRQSGRFAAEVTPQYKPLDQNRVDLIFEVTEGPVTGVRSINFIGNDAYSDSRLRSEIVTRQSRLWRFFSSNDNYDPDRLEFDRELLRQFYQNNGYYDFRTTSAVADLTPDQEDFYITFTVEEGEQYEFGEVKVETELDKLNEDLLVRAVPIKSGNLYRGDLIESSIDALTFAAGVAGYAFVDVRPRLEPNPETNKVDVTFALDEGPRVYIERINIVGNTTTLDRVVRREMRISEGDAFNRVLLDRSRNRIRALGFFQDVEITEQPGTEPDRSIVDVKVSEQPTGELSFAAGFSSVDSFLLDLSLSQRNLRGRGQAVTARVSASRRQQVVDLRFTEPRFLDRNIAAGIDVFSSRTDFSDISGTKTETTGGGVRIGFPLSDRTQLGLRYQIRADNVNINDIDVPLDANGDLATEQIQLAGLDTPNDATDDVFQTQFLQDLTQAASVVDICDDNAPASAFTIPQNGSSFISENFLVSNALCEAERSDLTSLLGYTFNWDRRNDPIEPTRGFDFSLNQDFAGVGGDVQYIRTEASGAFYRGLFKGVRASARLSGGYIRPFGDDDSVRITNRFFRGGSSFRGFDIAGLGPREVLLDLTPSLDVDGNLILDADGEAVLVETGRLRRQRALGGNAYYQGTFEVTVPNYLPEEYGIKSALFLDVGSLGRLEAADINDPTVVTLADGTIARFETRDPLSLRASAGLSVFWNSPFGPIRFDFAEILKAEEFDRTENFRFSTSTRF